MSRKLRREVAKERRRRARRARLLAGLGAALGASLGSAPAAHALQYTVDNLGDSNAATSCDATPSDCSLRQAINVANGTGAVDDVIVFQSGLSGTIALTNGQLSVGDALQINGPGASVIAVDANDLSRVITVSPSGEPLGISGLTLRDGDTLSQGGAIYSSHPATSITISDSVLTGNESGDGGAIYSYGPVTIEDSTVSENVVSNGSGGGIFIFAGSGSLSITDSVITRNEATDGFGGGINVLNADQVTIDGSTVSANQSETGGGIRVDTTSLTVRESTVSGNFAVGGVDGGGIRVDYSDDVSIERSTISGNEAPARAGGIAIDRSEVEVESSTVSGNRTTNPLGRGGGLFARQATVNDVLTISNSTIASNTVGDEGGGAYFDRLGAGAPDPALANTIVADNAAATARDLSGAWDASFSLIESPAGATITPLVAGSNISGQDPLLGPLANNGGPTMTRRPGFGSPALDKGSTAAGSDQRGVPRPLDVPTLGNSAAAGADGADIGAVELRAAEAKGPPCGGKPSTIAATSGTTKGTAGADVIRGTPKRDVIRGLGGNDVICGLGGKDLLIGGKGRDRLLGGKGRDVLRGGPGRDKLRGGPGRDRQRQ